MNYEIKNHTIRPLKHKRRRIYKYDAIDEDVYEQYGKYQSIEKRQFVLMTCETLGLVVKI